MAAVAAMVADAVRQLPLNAPRVVLSREYGCAAAVVDARHAAEVVGERVVGRGLGRRAVANLAEYHAMSDVVEPDWIA